MRALWLLPALGLVACAPPALDLDGSPLDDADVGRSDVAIVGGTAGGPDAVVVLQNTSNGGLCTGTLIAPRVVLTAKHCVQLPGAPGPVPPSDMIVGVGSNVRNLSQVLRVQSITATPGPWTERSGGGLTRDLIGVDVAVMVLQSGVPGLETIPVRRGSHHELRGQTVTAVGFGQTPSGQVGVKYTADGVVQGTEGSLIYVGPLICQGDSGGPAITREGEVGGVVSFGSGGCGSGLGAYNAITPFFDLIDTAIAEGGGECLPTGPEVCDGTDNDCNGEIDEGCAEIGEPCGADDQCKGQTCRRTPGGRICTTPCDPLRPEFGCAGGFYCARTGGCDGYCVPNGGDGAGLPNGAPCEADTECASLACIDPGDGVHQCLDPCRGDSGMCLAGEVCAAVAGACSGCMPEERVRTARGLGERCELDEDCHSEICIEDASRSYCSRECDLDGDCERGYHCRGDRCVSGPRGDIGDPCLENGDCVDGTFCAAQGGRRWCTRTCGDGEEPCPTGLECVSAGEVEVCAPERGLVGDPCLENDECISGLCAREGATGACTRLCGPDAHCAPGFECRRTTDGSSAVCVAPVPTATDGGGCRAGGPGGEGPLGGFVAIILGLALWRTRRRQS